MLCDHKQFNNNSPMIYITAISVVAFMCNEYDHKQFSLDGKINELILDVSSIMIDLFIISHL